MRRPFVAIIVIFAVLVSGCGLKLPDQISLPTQITGGDPKTLDAATKAAQEVEDRLSSGDFAGVWLMMSKQVRDKITQEDYVALQNACTKTGLPIKVEGVRLDGDGRAIVRDYLDLPGLSGFKSTDTMLYEDGKWVNAPRPEYAQDYGLPVQQIIAKRIAAGDCDKTAGESATATPSPTATNAAPLPTCPTFGPGDEPQKGPPCTPAPSNTTEQPPPIEGRGGSCSVNIPGCDGYAECHPVVTGKVDCFPDNESCSKPGNNFPWCSSPTTANEGAPAVVNCDQPPQVKPEQIILICDSTLAVDKIVWTSWTIDAGATGNGTEYRDDCVPNCAQGSATYSPVTITLTGAAPPDFRYKSAVVTNQNTGSADTWPLR